MCNLVPKEKILFGKRIMSIEQNAEGVMIRTSDGYFHHGDVLIGADGAYSAVRQALYRNMREKGLLPKEDDTSPPFNTFCLVGVTRPLPPGTFDNPEGECRMEGMLYKDRPYMVRNNSCHSSERLVTKQTRGLVKFTFSCPTSDGTVLS